MNQDELVAAARAAAEGSYSPYSNFRVGAVAVSKDGSMYTGANVENASYGVSSCAEAVVVQTAVASGFREIDTVVVACVDTDDIEGAYPCGRCRQIMSEFNVKRVIVTAGDGSEVREHTLEELLPHRFSL